MSTKPELDAYREKVFAAMSKAGLPLDEWQRQHEIELAANPTAKARPFTQISPPKYGKIQKLRPGFQEFIPHPAHGRPVPRCQAAKKRTDGKIQCAKFAIKGRHLCRTHGGAAGSGMLTSAGRENQRAAVTQHGNETSAKRQARKIAAQRLKAIQTQAREIGVITGSGSRGPYWKPNRVGQAMEHLHRLRKS